MASRAQWSEQHAITRFQMRAGGNSGARTPVRQRMHVAENAGVQGGDTAWREGCLDARGTGAAPSISTGRTFSPNPESSCLSSYAPRTAAPLAEEERLGDAVPAR